MLLHTMFRVERGGFRLSADGHANSSTMAQVDDKVDFMCVPRNEACQMKHHSPRIQVIECSWAEFEAEMLVRSLNPNP